MKVSSIYENETEQLEALKKLSVLNSEVSDDFYDIVALASQICNIPIANLTFDNKKRWWYNSKCGVGLSEMRRISSLCACDLEHSEFILIEDTLESNSFAKNPAVTGIPFIRFYAGFPITTEEGFTVGRLCLLDKTPRILTPQQLIGLQNVSRQVVRQLKLQLQEKKSKDAEEKLQTTEEKMQVLFNNTFDAVIVVSGDGDILDWNPKATSLFGWTRDEAIGKPFSDTVIAPRYRNIYREGLNEFKILDENQILNTPIEMAALHKNHAEIEIKLTLFPITVKGLPFFICFVTDNSERKMLATKLENQKEFYEIILNKIPRDIAVFDSQHKYLFVNEGAIKNEELRKYIIGKDDFEYAKYRNRDSEVAEIRRKKFLEVTNSKKEIFWEDTLKDPAGKDITHLRRLIPVYNKDEQLTMIIGFGIDITERKVLKERQAVLVKQLSGQNTQLIDFCNIVSHNLRAPLVNISMLVKFIEDSNDQNEQKNMIKMLKPVVNNLHTTFNELVESIQIKQDVEIKSEVMSLEDCLSRTIEGLDPEIKRSKATIEVNFTNAPEIKFPPQYLYSIFHNLVSNAVKYQSPLRKPVIKLKTQRINETILLSVSDNGLGIDLVKHKDNCFKIGKVFHSHPNAKGFGLYMTKTQVDAMGGQIWVESVPGLGSTFFIEFKNQN